MRLDQANEIPPPTFARARDPTGNATAFAERPPPFRALSLRSRSTFGGHHP